MLLTYAKWGLTEYQIIIQIKYCGIIELLFPSEERNRILSCPQILDSENKISKGLENGVQVYGDI